MTEDPTTYPNFWTFMVALVPTIAVVVGHLLQRRPLKEAARDAKAAADKTDVGNQAIADNAGELHEVKTLVNGQREQLQRDLDRERAANTELAATIAQMKGGRRNDDAAS